ncbi:MAG TPA: hypothetical protein VFH00_01985 [Candidatus Nitrosotalea sp.]|nr:hypothetical protein [Candidatus Nitrosotalea sp.]
MVKYGRFRGEALGAVLFPALRPGAGGYVMKCDLCSEEFANSEEVNRHKEEMHPMGDGKDLDIIENPGMSGSEVPEPAERRTS